MTENSETPAWRRDTAGEPRWHVTVLVVVALALQLTLPSRLGLQPRLLLPGIEVALLVALTAANPGRVESPHPALRYGSIALVAVLTVANATSAGLLVHELLDGVHATSSAGALLANGATIYVTNIIAFGIWYWEVDLGGPVARAHGSRQHPDLMFPQMASPELAPPHWEPMLADYLYVSYTNATAFSPTDTLPLTRWIKGVMALQSTVALVTLALVIARSVNILR